LTTELQPLAARTPQRWFYIASWHQGMYNAAAHRAHWAIANPHDAQRDERLRAADRYARRLLLVTASALNELHIGGKRKPTFLSKGERDAIEDFLRQIVEGSAAVLLGGIRLEFGEPYRPPQAINYPDDRRDLITKLTQEEHVGRNVIDPGWLARYGDASSTAARTDYNLACFGPLPGGRTRLGKTHGTRRLSKGSIAQAASLRWRRRGSMRASAPR
jgi:hypothetical protein